MADGIPDYDELKLRIEPHARGRISRRGVRIGRRDGHGRLPEPDLRDRARQLHPPRHAHAYAGLPLFADGGGEEARRGAVRAALAEDVGDLYHGAWRVADSQGRGLRISLSMTEAPELLEIPWELLYDPSEARFLSQSIYTPVVRSLDLKNPPAPRKVTLPLRVLALVSAPEGFPPLDAAAERRKLDDALAPLVNSGALLVEWLDSATPSELELRIAHLRRVARDPLHRARRL